MNANGITWVGMDAHKNSIAVAALFPERSEPVEWTETTTPEGDPTSGEEAATRGAW